MCGRCDSTVSSCDRDPSEHSFGLASQCSSCPNGWVRCFYYYIKYFKNSKNSKRKTRTWQKSNFQLFFSLSKKYVRCLLNSVTV